MVVWASATHTGNMVIIAGVLLPSLQSPLVISPGENLCKRERERGMEKERDERNEKSGSDTY